MNFFQKQNLQTLTDYKLLKGSVCLFTAPSFHTQLFDKLSF